MQETLNQEKFNTIYDQEGIFQADRDDGGQGDCFNNTKRLIEFLRDQEKINLEGWKAVVVEWNGGMESGWGIMPNDSELRLEEKFDAGGKSVDGGVQFSQWGFHVFLMDSEDKIYDLSASKDHFGQDIQDYMGTVFSRHIDRLGNGIKNEMQLRLIDTVDFLSGDYEEVKNLGRAVEFDDVAARVVKDGLDKEGKPMKWIDKAHEDAITMIKGLANLPAMPRATYEALLKREYDNFQRRTMPLSELLR